MNFFTTLRIRARRCPAASSFAALTAVFIVPALFFAIDQTTVMASELAKPAVMVLLGIPTFTGIMTVVFGSKCKMRLDANKPAA